MKNVQKTCYVYIYIKKFKVKFQLYEIYNKTTLRTQKSYVGCDKRELNSYSM